MAEYLYIGITFLLCCLIIIIGVVISFKVDDMIDNSIISSLVSCVVCASIVVIIGLSYNNYKTAKATTTSSSFLNLEKVEGRYFDVVEVKTGRYSSSTHYNVYVVSKDKTISSQKIEAGDTTIKKDGKNVLETKKTTYVSRMLTYERTSYVVHIS